ncbi:MAG: asparaginase domain-containing protein, partial [Bacteroidota bacterium]
MKSILIIFTGGTFSMKIDKSTGGAVPHFHGDQLLDMIPDASKYANISMCEYGMYPGPHMTPELMLDLSKRVSEYIQSDDVDGIIITHG